MKPDAKTADAPSTTDASSPDATVPTCVTSPPSLRARWRGDMNTEEDTGMYDGSAAGGIGYAAGRHGSAFVFDGIDDVVTADATDQLWPAGSFSVELWVKAAMLRPNIQYTALLSKYDCGGADACGPADWSMYLVNGGYPYFTLRVVGGGAASVTAANQPVVDGAWHHLVGVRDVTAKQLILYVDGVQAVSAPLGDTFLGAMTNDGAPDPVTIGANRVSGNNGLEFNFVGSLDGPAYYITALGASDVAAIYNAPQGFCP